MIGNTVVILTETDGIFIGRLTNMFNNTVAIVNARKMLTDDNTVETASNIAHGNSQCEMEDSEDVMLLNFPTAILSCSINVEKSYEMSLN